MSHKHNKNALSANLINIIKCPFNKSTETLPDYIIIFHLQHVQLLILKVSAQGVHDPEVLVMGCSLQRQTVWVFTF